MKVLLMDNGSLEAAPTLTLRAIAMALSTELETEVTPISLLHSSAVAAELIDGKPAEIFEPAVERRLRDGDCEFLIVPAFFGPSGALRDYLPRRIGALKNKYPQLITRLAAPLVDASEQSDSRIATILEQRVRSAAASSLPMGFLPDAIKPKVILLDHGSPAPAVTAVRNHVATQLKMRLSDFALETIAASMERRPGPEYAFSDPLLENVFDQPGFDTGTVIIALLFISAGRHAGPNGDIAKICNAAKLRHPGLRPVMLEPIGPDPLLIQILAERARSGYAQPPL